MNNNFSPPSPPPGHVCTRGQGSRNFNTHGEVNKITRCALPFVNETLINWVKRKRSWGEEPSTSSQYAFKVEETETTWVGLEDYINTLVLPM